MKIKLSKSVATILATTLLVTSAQAAGKTSSDKNEESTYVEEKSYDNRFYVSVSYQLGGGDVDYTIYDTLNETSELTGTQSIENVNKLNLSFGVGDMDGWRYGFVYTSTQYDKESGWGFGFEFDRNYVVYDTKDFAIAPYLGMRVSYASIDNIAQNNTTAEGYMSNVHFGISALITDVSQVYLGYEYNYDVYDTGDNAGSQYTTNAHFKTSGVSFGTNIFF